MARSGTTAFAQAINLHPHVFCGIESIVPNYDLSNAVFPDVFFDASVCGENAARKNLKIFGEKEITKYGNKFPRYFLYLDLVSGYCEDVKNFGIYREGFDFVHSWNKRVEAGKNWHPGRTGLVGILEQIMMFRSLLEVKNKNNVYLFSYNRMLKEDLDNINKFFEVLGVDASLIRDDFCRDVFNKSDVLNKERKKSYLENYAVEFFGIKKFDELFYDHSGESLDSFTDGMCCELKVMVEKSSDFLKEIGPELKEVEKEFILKQKGLYRKSFPELLPALEELKLF